MKNDHACLLEPVLICSIFLLFLALALPIGSTPPTPASQPVVQKPVKPFQPAQPQQVTKTIRVVFPNGGETLIRGKTYRLQWQSKFMSNVQLRLNGSRGFSIGTVAANSGSYQWKIPHDQNRINHAEDVQPGSYTLRLSDTSGNPFDDSDSAFQVVLPEVDLECWYHKRDVGSNVWNTRIHKIRLRNNGSRILNDVLFNWVIKKNGTMIDQSGAGYGQVYPNTNYECEIRVDKKGDENWNIYSIDFYLDPQNLKGEDPELRDDNQLTFR